MAVEAVLRGVVFYVASFPDGPQDSGNLRTSFHAEGGRKPLWLRLGLCDSSTKKKEKMFSSNHKTACVENYCFRCSVFCFYLQFCVLWEEQVMLILNIMCRVWSHASRLYGEWGWVWINTMINATGEISCSENTSIPIPIPLYQYQYMGNAYLSYFSLKHSFL